MRECLETWHLQSKDGPVTVEALEAILSRSMVPILRQMEEKPPELVMALLPSLVRTMLAAFVEVMGERSGRVLRWPFFPLYSKRKGVAHSMPSKLPLDVKGVNTKDIQNTLLFGK